MRKVSLDRSLSFTLTFFLFLQILVAFNLPTLLGAIAKYILVCLVIIILFKLIALNHFSLKKIILFIPIIVFELIYVFGLTTDKNVFFLVFYQAFFILFLYLLISVSWNKNQVKILAIGTLIIYALLIYHTFISSSLVNPNTLGVYSYLLMFFPLIYFVWDRGKVIKLRVLVFLAIPVLIIFFSDSRSVILSTLFCFATLIIWKLITKNKFVFYLYFFAILTFIYFVVAIYPNLSNILPNFLYYENLSLTYTGKSLLSGRNEIWITISELIKQKPYLGYGPNVSIEEVIGTQLSAHNLYIQITLQVGFIGLSLFLLFLLFIWRTLWLGRKDTRVAIASSFFIGIIIHQTFEVSLTQNNFGVGLIQWLIIGVGLSFCFNSYNQKNEKTSP